MAAMDPGEWSLNAILFFFLFQFCDSMDTVTPTQPIKDGDILVSTGERFALGFFSPGSSRDRYLGIWYNKVSEQSPVWVANRETSVKNFNGVLMINGYGNLIVFDKNQNSTAWSTYVALPHNDSIAKLLDSGNLVLIQNHSKRVLWQSFDYPTHTLLPGMKIGLNKKTGLNWLLTSWKSRSDPASGNYSFSLDPRGSPQFFLYKGSTPYWRSGPWIGNGFNGIPEMGHAHFSNFSFVHDQDKVYITYSLFNDSIFSRYVLDETGSLKPLTWLEGIDRWNSFGLPTMDQCDLYGLCGPYGSCSTKNDALECGCLPGFEPKSSRDWRKSKGFLGKKRNLAILVVPIALGFFLLVSYGYCFLKKMGKTEVQKDHCDTYGLCGPYGICNINKAPNCECLKGFTPKSPQDWDVFDTFGGCVRTSSLDCRKGEGFVKLTGVKLPDTSDISVNMSMSNKECEVECLKNCSCVAYSIMDINGSGNGCVAWFRNLIDIRQSIGYGQDL
ncbi:hypothetical protein HHK36_003812 [Tetracentron sinense]|uniref:non-specific serine/threonine protein kinase n=1 Tax=Tetracentron sinense TaxID=13715 RepID=A0A834ZTM2_TETSI|nr:hypothetical protein HHK36_003812 [Tetracentron sinense]